MPRHAKNTVPAKAKPAPSHTEASGRPPRLKLPAFFPFAVGQAAVDHVQFDAEPLAREEAARLAGMVRDLLPQAKIVADPVTRLSAGHAVSMFRPVLDRIAAYLTRWYGGRDERFKDEVQPPCNFPMPFQSAFMQLAEAVQASQVWDAQQSVDPLPKTVVQTLENVAVALGAVAQVDHPKKIDRVADKKQEARNKWIYQQCCKGSRMPYDKIVADLKKTGSKKGWQMVSSKQRIQQIGNEYAKVHNLPPPPPRQRL